MYPEDRQQAIEAAERAVEFAHKTIDLIDVEKAELQVAMDELGYKRSKALKGLDEAEAYLRELGGSVAA